MERALGLVKCFHKAEQILAGFEVPLISTSQDPIAQSKVLNTHVRILYIGFLLMVAYCACNAPFFLPPLGALV